MSPPPEPVDDCPLSDEINISAQQVTPAVAPSSDAAARDDGSHGDKGDVEPRMQDAAELVEENSCSASLMAPSFELNNGPISPEPGSSGEKGESEGSATAVSIALGVLFR